jgi:2,4-dienoyl-CoA reductase (NADPH2)
MDMPARHLLDRLFGSSLPDPFVAYLKASEIVFMRDFLAEPERLRQSLAAIGLLESAGTVCSAVA